jgi:hypothetical protein
MYPKPVYDLSGWAIDAMAVGGKHIVVSGKHRTAAATVRTIVWRVRAHKVHPPTGRRGKGRVLGPQPLLRRAGKAQA